MIAFFRQWAKGFIWFIVIAFVLATFLGSASMMWVLDQQDQARRAAQPTGLQDGGGPDEAPDPRLESTKPMARLSLEGEKAVITEGDLEKRIRRTELSRGETIDEAQRKFMVPWILERMVQEKLVLMEAERLDLDVSAQVDEQLEKIFENAGKEQYLASTGQTEAELREVMTRQFQVSTLLQRVRNGRHVTDAEARAYYQANQAEFTTEGAAAARPFDEIKDEVLAKVRADIRPEHIQEYYQANRSRWRKPPRMHLLHLALDARSQARLEASTPTEDELKAWYEAHPEDYKEREQVDFSHIFVDPKHPDLQAAADAAVTDEEVQRYYDANRDDFAREETLDLAQVVTEGEGAEDRIRAALERLKAGEPFAKVAASASDDEATKASGGSLGAVAALDLPAELAEVAFALDQGRITDPIKVGDRWHLLHIGDKHEGALRPLDEVRAEIVRELKSEKAWELAEARAGEAAEAARADGADFAGVAQRFSHAGSASTGGKIGLVRLGENEPSALLDEVGTQGFLEFAIQKALQGAEAGSISDPVRSFRGFHVLRVDARPEPGARPLDDVRGALDRAVRKDKAEAWAKTLIEDIRSKVRKAATGGAEASPEKGEAAFRAAIAEHSESSDKASKQGDWGEVVLDPGVAPDLPTDVRAEVLSWNGLARPLVNALKDLKSGEVSGVVELSGKRHLFYVVSRSADEFTPLADLEDEIRQALNPSVTDEEVAEYFEANRAEFERDVAPKGETTFHILLASKADAEEALATITSGEKTFDEVARSDLNRDRIAAPQGGKIQGTIAIPAIRAALDSTAAGEVHPKPVQSPVGWHILKAGEAEQGGDEPEEVTLESVRDQIETKLLEDRRQALQKQWMDELRERAEVERLLEGVDEAMQAMMRGFGGA